jgi:hypothetical protein
MTIADLRITESAWKQLRRLCAPSFRGERRRELGAIGVIGDSQTPRKRDLLVTAILWPGEGDITESTGGSLVFSPSYLRRAHLMMRRQSLAGIITFHTHPHSDGQVEFSPYDDRQDPMLASNLQELAPQTQLVSVVLGQRSQCGRLWSRPDDVHPLDELVVVGERLQYLPLDGSEPTTPPPPAAAFDRAAALTGSGALAQLGRMRIAIVGASGTGSLLCELLLRAGAKDILLIDHDVVKIENLNRILYARAEDVRLVRSKPLMMKERLEAAGMGLTVEPVVGSLLDQRVLSRLREVDVVFGCVDRAYPRLLMCQHAFQYLTPLIDVGTEIGANAEGIVSLDARLSYITPERPCLMCTGVISRRAIRFESLAYEEQRREFALGYSDDLVLQQPAVMDLNMRAASLGMFWLRHLLQPFLLEPLPLALKENLITYSLRKESKARALNAACPVCQANQYIGYGDCGPQYGLSEEQVRVIHGPEYAPHLNGMRRSSGTPVPQP